MIPSSPVISGVLHANSLGSVTAMETENTWRASTIQRRVTHSCLSGIERWQTSVCGCRAAAVFVIGIYRAAQRWSKMTGRCISCFKQASCNYRCFSGMHFSHFTLNILTCKCPLFPIVPLTTTSNGMSDQRLDGRRRPVSIFFFFSRIITFFSLPLHIISKTSCVSLPPHLSADSARQKDKLPSGLLF